MISAKQTKTKQETEIISDKKLFTEVFSWGNDDSGQLGLGQKLGLGKTMHFSPRFCSYKVQIIKIACG